MLVVTPAALSLGTGEVMDMQHPFEQDDLPE